MLAKSLLVVGLVGALFVTTPDGVSYAGPGAAESRVSAKKTKKKVGRIKVVVKGVPAAATAQVTVTGAHKFARTVTQTATLAKVPVGTYRVSATPVATSERSYTLHIKPKGKVKVRRGKLARVRVWYTAVGGVQPPPQAPVVPLRFNIKDAAGVALPSGGSGAPSGVNIARSGEPLLAVDADGSLRNAVEHGSLLPYQYIASTYAGPDGSLYLAYGGSSGPGTCMLAKVDRVTGLQTCITSNDSANAGTPTASMGSGKSAIQFDRSGRMYYSGTSSSAGVYYQYIRRVDGGQTTDLVNLGNVMFEGWVVAADGTILVSGITNSTNQRWLRAISASGAIKNLGVPTGGQVRLLGSQFPDGNVYMTWSESGANAVRRYLVDQGVLDPRFWIANPSQTPDPVWDCVALEQYGTCAFSEAKAITTTTAGGVWTLFSTGFNGSRLARVYPSFAVPTLSLTPLALAAVGERVALSGLDAAQRQTTVLVDPNTNTERVLLGPDNEIEVFRLNYSAPTGLLMFDGLRYSDGKYVVGSINPNTGVVKADTSGKLAQFITLN